MERAKTTKTPDEREEDGGNGATPRRPARRVFNATVRRAHPESQSRLELVSRRTVPPLPPPTRIDELQAQKRTIQSCEGSR